MRFVEHTNLRSESAGAVTTSCRSRTGSRARVSRSYYVNCYCYMDLYGVTISLSYLLEQHEVEGQEKKWLLERSGSADLIHHRVSCCVVLMVLAESAAVYWNPVPVTATGLYGLLYGLTLKWVPPRTNTKSVITVPSRRFPPAAIDGVSTWPLPQFSLAFAP